MRILVPLAGLIVACIVGCGPAVPSRQAASKPDSAIVVLPIDAAGLRVRVADGGAKVTVVNVWATWCGPCREEFPALVAAGARHRGDGVRLLLVSADFDEALPDARRFLEANGVRDTSFIKAEADMAFINGVHPAWSGALPATLLYDSRGRVLEFWEGSADSAQFERAITRALQEKGAPS